MCGGLSVGGTVDYQPDHFFARPFVLNEFAGQPFEQGRVRGGLAADSKIADGADEPITKQVGPHVIDRYARHKWVFAVDQPARQIQPVTLRAVFYGGQGFGRDCQHGFFGLFKFATIQHMRFARAIGSLGDDAHAHHWGLGRAGFEFL